MSRIAIIQPIVFGFLTFFLASTSFGQSTISDEPFELTYGSGPFGVLLPSYQLGTDAGGATAFQDDGDTLGGLWKVDAVRRFLGTRTSFETTAFYGWVEANSSGSATPIDVTNPATGVAAPTFAAAGTHLESSLNHYGVDITLRDTWRTRFGGLSAGTSFSYMAFDQEFKLDRDGSRFLSEDLDSDYVGGKAFLGWDGCLMGRRSKLDFAVGYFDLDVDYRYNGSAALPGSLTDQLADYATTVETDFTTYFPMMGFDSSLTIGVMYISKMAQIVHDPAPAVASLTTDDAVLISGMVQIAL